MKLPKNYEAGNYESNIYDLWEKQGVFVAHPDSDKEHYSISMPPPNETGTLSIGHALFLTLQDILARHARQEGKDVLWLPGTDHAALPVNAIIEKQLLDEGTNKHIVGREEFLRRTREFVSNSRATMLSQMRAMGASADWSRLRYTLDDALNRCVNETFVKMYEDGLIYRGHRIVNWDPNLETNVSDDEVAYIEEKSTFYTFKYGPFEIGTARPETKFGDKYVVMHPDDKRYAQYKHGDTFEADWINGPITATIIKDEAADPNFGTGVMTITPWHSLVDFEIAERHNLKKEQIISFHGKLLPIAGEFADMPIFEARPLIVEKMAKKGLLVKTEENYIHNIAINERGKGIIEPQIRLQWFIDVNKAVVPWKGKQMSLKQVLQSVIRDEDIDLIPERFQKIYFHWIDNLRDWCISRQIWWGHRIPVWYHTTETGIEETYVGVQAPSEIAAGQGWEQDADTLDTWFSSALWTWSTLIDQELAKDYSLSLDQLLEKSPDFNAYHPTNVMETGWDIIFFWVARMILTTTYVTGEIPFKDIYLHGMVRAEDGKKMSKSRPESIVDPQTIIDKFGTDSLRMALIMGVSPGNDQNWGSGKIEANRNFCNKLWNIARYIEDTAGDISLEDAVSPKTSADQWILSKLNTAQDQINKDIDGYRFSEAYDRLYHFIWNDLADWYIEASKASPNKRLLKYVLESILIMAHPFAPFVTEAIWQTLAWRKDSILASTEQSELIQADTASADSFASIQSLVTEIRFITKALKVSKVTLKYEDDAFFSVNGPIIKQLARLAAIEQGTKAEKDTGIALVDSDFSCWLAIDRSAAKSYISELETKQVATQAMISQLENRLANENYVKNAPEKVVNQTKDQLAESEKLLENLKLESKRFEAI